MEDKKLNNLSKKLSNSKFFQKLKSIKNVEIIIVGLFLIILLGIYFINFNSSDSNSSFNEKSSAQFTSYNDYTNDLETRLTKVLAKIEGIDDVNVMITLESSPELVIAYSLEEKTITNTQGTTVNDSVTIVKDPIIVSVNGSSSPLILTEILPKIKGVMIVAKGANDIKLKLDILNATSKLLGVSINSIEIFAGD